MTPKQSIAQEQSIAQDSGKGGRRTPWIGVLAIVSTIILSTWGCTSCQKNDYDSSSDTYMDENVNEVSEENNFEVQNQEQMQPSFKSESEEMIRLIASEAPDAPYEVKVAIAALLINRAEEQNAYDFANTVYDVIHQYGQFESVTEGRLLPIEAIKTDAELYLEISNAVTAAQEGEDPTGGALFFFQIKDGAIPFPNGITLGEEPYLYSFANRWPENWG